MNITKSKIAIELQNLTKDFGNLTAVSNMTLELPYGSIIGFLGPNGAGKSTTMKMIANLINPTDGAVLISCDGHQEKLSRNNKDKLLSNIGFLIENPDFYGHMTPRQVLKYFATLKSYPKKQINSRVEEVLELVGMSQWIDKKIKTFSKGMRQKIGIASALVHDPEILILDEPQSGLDPQARKEIRQLLLDLKDAGKTIFLSSHLLYEVSEISDKIAIINKGELIAFDTVENLELSTERSVLQIELVTMPDDIQNMIEQLTSIIAPIIKQTDKQFVFFNKNLNVFEVTFDGKNEHKAAILEALLRNQIKVSEFSVPRTNLLESLYIDFMVNGNGKVISSKGDLNDN